MPEKKGDLSVVSYSLGIVSIVMAFFQPLAGLTFGIISLVQSKKQDTELSKRAKKLSKIGIILSIVLFIVSVVIAYLQISGAIGLQDFPIN